VVSPFLDKRHGTERAVVEWISRLGPEFEVHIYSQRVEDLDLSQLTWHRVSALPGPHAAGFLWWFAANQVHRWWDNRFKGLAYDVVFTPGVNCFDADVIAVFVVFSEYVRRVRHELSFRRNALSSWPRLLHRKLYYRLIAFFERRVYTREGTTITLIARKTGAELERHYGRKGPFPVIYLGLDLATFNPDRRRAMRAEARAALGLVDDRFVLVLICNDWHNKGVPVLLDAFERIPDVPVDLLIAGGADPAPWQKTIAQRGLTGRIHSFPPRKDVEFYYAAADAYVGPSLEDTFALPPEESMACGLPVIVSSANGTCEIITDGTNGLVLQDPTDAASLAAMIRRLYEDRAFAQRLGDNAAETARRFAWEHNSRDLAAIFHEIAKRKAVPETQPVTKES
jgi:glycosyltransferase involved in cell wall biosynthesis